MFDDFIKQKHVFNRFVYIENVNGLVQIIEIFNIFCKLKILM